jgi:ribosome-binding factor A
LLFGFASFFDIEYPGLPHLGDDWIAMKTHRLARVAEVVREVAAETILFQLQDPRVKGVTVTRAEVAADLQHAKVYVSLMGTKKEQDLCLHGLRHAAGFIQSQLAGRLKTRYTPTIRFVVDEGVKKSIEVTRLINEALAQSRPNPEPQSAEGTAEEDMEEEG